MIQIPQSTSRVVMLKLFTTGTTTAATGKTVAITISKAGAAFGNPNAGATNATEVSSGWYKVTLDTTDTGTVGDLVVRGTATGCDDTERIFGVVKATNGGLTALPDAAAEASGGLFTRGSGVGQITQDANGRISVNVVAYGGSAGTFASGRPEVNTSHIAGTAQTGLDIGGNWTAARATKVDNLDAAVSTRLASASYTAPLDAAGTRSAVGLASANLDTQIGTLAGYVDTEVAAIKAKTDNLPAAPAAVGDIPTAAANAAAWGASIIGNGRTRDYFLQGGANKIAFAADGLSFTVYGTDDTTELYTGTSTRLATSVGGLRSIDPV